MAETRLFRTRAGDWISDRTILQVLEQIRAQDAKVLYMHTELSFGMPNPELSRKQILDLVLATILDLKVPNLCVPTFTFSFCNGEDYDVRNSRTRMGGFNDYFRQRPDALRSLDPLLSTALIGPDHDLVENLGHHSIGQDSNFDRLHLRPGVKFLFLGASPAKCFTYLHYVEEREHVPYRYDRDFSGKITAAGRTWQDTYTLFVRYQGVVPDESGAYERYLLDKALLRKEPIGDGFISVLDEPVAYETIAAKLKENIDYFLARPYPRDRQDTEFKVSNMVTL